MNLERMQCIIKSLPGRVNRVYNNNNFPDTLKIGGLIYATSYVKQFSFSSYNINHMMDSFDDLFVMNMNMRDGSNNLILYAGIEYYKSNWEIQRESESNIVKGLNIYFEIFVALFT